MKEELQVDWAAVPVRSITGRQDVALASLFDIYQKSFPLEQQMLLSFFLEKLEQKERGEAPEFHLEALASDRQVAGFAFYEIGEEVEGIGRAGYLWYLAANPDIRSKGIGKRLYHHVRERMFQGHACRGMFFEIEQSPDVRMRHGQSAADCADWRKEWYKRQGALELAGTHYLCSADWPPPLPMQVMVHPNGPLSADDALALSREVQSESIAVVGHLSLI